MKSKKTKSKLTVKQRREQEEKAILTQQVYSRGVAIENLQHAAAELREALARLNYDLTQQQSELSQLRALTKDQQEVNERMYQASQAVAIGMVVEADELDSRSARLEMRVKALGFDRGKR